MIYMILLLIVGTFLGEYESSYVKKHEEQFSQQEYQWIMAIGTCVIATAMIMFFSSSIDRSVLWDMRVVLGTCIMTCLTILFIRLNIRLTQTAERSFSSQFSVLAIPLMMLADSILGYEMTLLQMIVMGVITCIFIIQNRGMGGNRAHVLLALGVVTTGVVTMSIFKYMASHWVSTSLLIFLAAVCNVLILFLSQHKALLQLLRRRRDFAIASRLAIFHGASSLLCSFALSFGIASIVVTIKRVLQLSWSLVFSKVVFHEHHIVRKSIITGLLALCVITMQLPVLMPTFAHP